MADFKVRLTIMVPGAVMYSKQLCFQTSEVVDNNGNIRKIETPIEGMTDTFTTNIGYFNKQANGVTNRKVTLHIPKCKPAYQVLNISQQSYRNMIDASMCPEWFRVPGKNAPNEWRRLTNQQRLELHLKRTADGFNGVVDNYFIAED